MSVLKQSLEKIIFLQAFLYFQLFQFEASGRTCSCVRTCVALPNVDLAVAVRMVKWRKIIYFVDEVETRLREKPLRGSQIQDIHYSEDKASYKAVALTYPYAVWKLKLTS